jgi:hypothetical protein
VSAVVGYRGAFGDDSYNGVGGWFAGTFRPGNLRIAAGPTYDLLIGSGTGVAEWWDKNQDPSRYPPGDLSYWGYARIGGARLTAGYGLLDLGPFTGLIELGGQWGTDGSRSYVGGGLRIGIVPKIERYEG